jgi:WD40 repeat protein
MENNLIYGLNGFQTRSLAAQQDSEEIRFFIGTQGINQKNQIHLLEVDDEGEELKSKIFSHDGEIWKLTTCPNDKLLASVYSSSPNSMKTCILKIPNEIFNNDPLQEILEFEQVEVLDVECSEIKTTEFHSTNKVATVTDSKLLVFNRAEAKTQIVTEVNTKNTGKFAGGKWYNAHQFVVMHENGIKSFDTRDSNIVAFEIPNAHIQPIRDLDVNPNKAFTLATVGDDSALKIWDVRNNKMPLFSRRDHQHWITSVSFNKFHDQLILTASTDGTVLLTCASSCSSENIDSKANNANLNEESPEIKEAARTQLPDGLLEKFEHHEDSVYCAEWAVDPWIFASLSWEGRVVIKKVPKKYKYQILL